MFSPNRRTLGGSNRRLQGSGSGAQNPTSASSDNTSTRPNETTSVEQTDNAAAHAQMQPSLLNASGSTYSGSSGSVMNGMLRLSRKSKKIPSPTSPPGAVVNVNQSGIASFPSLLSPSTRSTAGTSVSGSLYPQVEAIQPLPEVAWETSSLTDGNQTTCEGDMKPEAKSVPLFGTRPSKKNSLTEDLPLNVIQQQEQHASLAVSGLSSDGIGSRQARPSSSLLDDDEDDDGGSAGISGGRDLVSLEAFAAAGDRSAVSSSTVAMVPSPSKPQVSFAALPMVREGGEGNIHYADPEDSKLPATGAATNKQESWPKSTSVADDVEDAKEYARALRSLCETSKHVDSETLEVMLTMCTNARETVNNTIQSALTVGQDGIDDLLQLNEHLSHAIAMGEKAKALLEAGSNETQALSGEHRRTATLSPVSSKGMVIMQPAESAASLSHVIPTTSTRQQSSTTLNVEAMVEKQDVFSLICMLRAQQTERRLDAAYALMEFARETDDTCNLRHEIRSSGGLHSLLTLFRVQDTPYETKVVVALAVAYLLPEVDKILITQGLTIVECLRLLSSARKITPNGRVITEKECQSSAVKGLLMFWMNLLLPMLANERKAADEQQGSNDRMLVVRSTSGSSRWRTSRVSTSGGGLFDQRRDLIELQELLDVTVSLIVSAAELRTDRPILDEALTLIEAVCAVEVARPIAVREGVLRTLVGWIKSKDPEKIRPAASALRHLTSIKDSYMAGWIHSQIVNEENDGTEGILGSLVQLMQNSDRFVGNDEQLAVAQILSSLCVAPHTRAAVAKANGISLLIQFLVEASTEGAYYAGSALVQLASGAITRATVFGDDAFEPHTNEVVDTIIETGAIESFVRIAQTKKGKLRFMAIEALRVLSEDFSPSRQTRAELCYHGAAKALGIALKDFVESHGELCSGQSLGLDDRIDVKELHEALCALANILDPISEAAMPMGQYKRRQSSDGKDTLKLQIVGCKQTTDSGGLQALLVVASIPLLQEGHSPLGVSHASRMSLLEETCRSLAYVAPLLLNEVLAASGYAKWTDDILNALYKVTKQLMDTPAGADSVLEAVTEVQVNVIRGLAALAGSEPLKIRIIDRFLPFLLVMNSGETSNAANQAFQSLGFTDDEVAIQVAGNNAQLLADWFCLARSCVIQAMARDEIQQLVRELWSAPFRDTSNSLNITRLIRDSSDLSRSDDGSSVCNDLFENFASDTATRDDREKMLRQYRDIYGSRSAQPSVLSEKASSTDEDGSPSDYFLSRQIYPLSSSELETEWVLSHDRSRSASYSQAAESASHTLSTHVLSLLKRIFPSQLLRSHVLPIQNLIPSASFNFRGMMMPQRRYFSFRREGQLLSRLCASESVGLDSTDVHWTLGFTNSTFAGEFSESLVQALYMCPMIIGLSFAREGAAVAGSAESEESDDDGGAILANLVGSLPPWISCLTFDGLLSDRDMKSLVAILETVGKLSINHDVAIGQQQVRTANTGASESCRISSQGQGRFCFLAVSRSPRIQKEVWRSFFRLLGVSDSLSRGSQRPLSTLKILDLSGNHLGDDLCATVLQLAHDKDSGCMLEQLDLSGNRIMAGTSVLKVFRNYVEYHRYAYQAGRATVNKGWKSPLHTLILADNGLCAGNAWVEIISRLKHNALELRVLDLSNNGLILGDHDVEFCDAVVSALLKNTCIRRLSLSRNKFGAGAVSQILDRLTDATHESVLAFLELDENDPPLHCDGQENVLKSICERSRRCLLQRLMNDRERSRSTAAYSARDLSLLELDSTNGLQQSPFPEDVESLAVSSTREVVDRLSLQKDPNPSLGENAITVLFSAPLVFFDDRNTMRPFAKLDFGLERELMWQCLKEASRDIELYFDNATTDRFLAAISKRCTCLHYSGHGHQTCLPFEDKGGPQWMSIERIQGLIARDGGASFRFVFVSACYSFNVGQTFASAGVRHVVCCEEESELKDAAALAFTRNFYLALAVGNTVRESFDQGCRAVRATPNLRNAEQEMKKFRLLPEDGLHDVPIFVNAKPVLEWPRSLNEKAAAKNRRSSTRGARKGIYSGGTSQSELSVRNMIQEDPSPSPPQFFLGREVDMYKVLRLVLEQQQRLISVVGEVGIGRSSLVCALCHYVNERASTMPLIEHIYFVKAKQDGRQKRSTALIRRLLQRLAEADKLPDPRALDTDIETMTDTACRALKNDKALLVFDRVDLLDEADEVNEFPIALKSLLSETRNLKILLTNRRPLGIPSIGEKSYELGPLNLGNTVRLFAFLCPYVHTPKERQKLFKSLVTDFEQESLLPTDPGLSDGTMKLFTALGSGVPSLIEKAAYNVSKEVFLSLMNGSILDPSSDSVEAKSIEETDG